MLTRIYTKEKIDNCWAAAEKQIMGSISFKETVDNNVYCSIISQINAFRVQETLFQTSVKWSQATHLQCNDWIFETILWQSINTHQLMAAEKCGFQHLREQRTENVDLGEGYVE